MKEEEASRIASMNRLDLETLDSLTSLEMSNEEAGAFLDELEGGQVGYNLYIYCELIIKKVVEEVINSLAQGSLARKIFKCVY